MTVVARVIVERLPLLIGDLLVSGDEVPSQCAHVPTIGSVRALYAVNFRLSLEATSDAAR